MAIAEIVEDRADETDVVDTTVLEEVAVFDGSDGGDEVFRQLVVRDEAALGTVLVGESGDQLRLEFVGS